MCMFKSPSGSSAETEPPAPPREPDPLRQAKSLQEVNRRRRAAAYNTGKTTLTGPLGVSDYASHSKPGVTLLGRA
ncbi:MAG: hypothetical protein K5905_30265 [Roseibium sp.]|uniref:hypothetical protein n=1 Tax=Roseibium sp. TaxID=1936156 RepID=UPI00261DE8FD|nr:hypothetical protein [Roseibium sp.]MCV0429744.1 hypothetical protein [Roseibium sp.]